MLNDKLHNQKGFNAGLFLCEIGCAEARPPLKVDRRVYHTQHVNLRKVLNPSPGFRADTQNLDFGYIPETRISGTYCSRARRARW